MTGHKDDATKKRKAQSHEFQQGIKRRTATKMLTRIEKRGIALNFRKKEVTGHKVVTKKIKEKSHDIRQRNQRNMLRRKNMWVAKGGNCKGKEDMKKVSEAVGGGRGKERIQGETLGLCKSDIDN